MYTVIQRFENCFVAGLFHDNYYEGAKIVSKSRVLVSGLRKFRQSSISFAVILLVDADLVPLLLAVLVAALFDESLESKFEEELLLLLVVLGAALANELSKSDAEMDALDDEVIVFASEKDG